MQVKGPALTLAVVQLFGRRCGSGRGALHSIVWFERFGSRTHLQVYQSDRCDVEAVSQGLGEILRKSVLPRHRNFRP